MADNEDIPPTSPDNDKTSAPLTDEQEDALKKIMAELEGKPSPDNKDDKKEDPRPPQGLPENGLTDEQEEALQKIMAEIESSDKSTSEPQESVPPNSITSEQEETLNKIVAELQGDAPSEEKNQDENDRVESAEAPSTPEDLPQSENSAQEELTSEQEAALQKIMEEIEATTSKNTDATSSSEPDPAEISTESSSEVRESTESEHQSVDSADEVQDSAGGFEGLDLSEFESELQKVVSEAKAQQPPKAKPSRFTKPTIQPSPKTPSEKPPEEPSQTETSADVVTQTEPDTKSGSVDPTTVDAKNFSESSRESFTRLAKSASQAEEKDSVAPKPAAPKIEATTAKKASRPSSKPVKKGRWKKIFSVCLLGLAGLMISIAAVQWFSHLKHPKPAQNESTSSEESAPAQNPTQSHQQASSTPSANDDGTTNIQNDTLAKILKEIIDLRGILIDKLKDIKDLKSYYTQGILETEEDLLEWLHTRQMTRLNDALADQRIELGLRTIQRRKTYIDKLDTPFNQLLGDSEELLYLERKATIFQELIGNTSGTNLDPFEKQVEEAIARIRLAKENLSIDNVNVTNLPLEAIWKEIIAKNNTASAKKLSRSEQSRQNRAIWKEICSGNFDRKYALTELDETTAKCLLQWEGKDLYLNRITELTPSVAQILSHWKGEWLGLNGLETLAPEVALQLARWKGKHLSLNGLTELSPKATLYLSKWQGEQLELVGLKYIGQWDNPKIELFVSDKLRNQIPK